jgi:5-(carboxyamino)imidazole ribonucleotide mutase
MVRVGIVIGSETDRAMIEPALTVLQDLGVDYELSVISGHRNPARAREYGMQAADRGIEVIVAAAGGAAHLPGILASWTTLPVIGVPLPATDLKGLDALLSIVQMPGGVPVACVGIGRSGAKNAALLAVQIVGAKHEEIRLTYCKYKLEMGEGLV